MWFVGKINGMKKIQDIYFITDMMHKNTLKKVSEINTFYTKQMPTILTINRVHFILRYFFRAKSVS